MRQVLGFLTYDVILTLGLDRIYTAPYFLALMALLAASLAACTSTRSSPPPPPPGVRSLAPQDAWHAVRQPVLAS